MPNGFYGSKQELGELEKPLLEIDGRLQRFCGQNGLELTRNDRNSIGRAVRWTGPDGISRGINLFLVDERKMAFKLLGSATQSRLDGEYAKSLLIEARIESPFKLTELMQAIESARALLNKWSAKDLRKVKMG